MLKLRDIFHLPVITPHIQELIADGPGVTLVAGLDPRPTSANDLFIPSGRTAIFRILIGEILSANEKAGAIIVARDKEAVRIPRQFKRRIELSLVGQNDAYDQYVRDAAGRRPFLLVVDQITPETAPVVFEAVQQGVRVLTQLDTIFRGAEVARQLNYWGVSMDLLAGLRWVLGIQRLPTLCPECRQPLSASESLFDELACRYPALAEQSRDLYTAEPFSFYKEGHCAACENTGHQGNLTAFDVFQRGEGDLLQQASVYPLEAYLLELAKAGHISFNDLLRIETEQFHQTYNLLTAREETLAQTNRALQQKLLELEAANRVLSERTDALISLEDISQMLITSNNLNELAEKVCRRARELCGADRVILYYLRTPDEAEVLGVDGWERALLGQRMPADVVCDRQQRTEPNAYPYWPPGVEEDEAIDLRTGLAVPLMVQQERVGLMLVHNEARNHFKPGDVALLRTFANQAAVAIQRSGLIAQLRAKIEALEAAQAELIEKERLERELELARQVQQSVLPHVFPDFPSFAFAAHNAPARQVGGDFYDVVALDDEHFGVVIADVSDKGMPAALYMTMTRSLLLAEARRERSPRAVLENVNELLLQLGEQQIFVSVFYGVVHVPTGLQFTHCIGYSAGPVAGESAQS